MTRWRSWLPWLPIGLAAVFAAVFLVELRDIVLSVYTNSDNASGPVLAELLHQAPAGRQVLLGNYPWYEPLWFMLATRGLPAHRAIWELAPFAFTAVGWIAVAGSAAAALGRWAGATVLAVLAVPSVLLVDFLATGNAHGHTMVHACVLGAAVVVFAARGARWGAAPALAAGAVLGALSAPGVASDELLVFAGLIPLAVAAVAVTSAGGGRGILLFAGAAEAVAIGGAIALHHAATAAQILPVHREFVLVDGDVLFSHLRLLWQVAVAFGHGDFFGQKIDAAGVLAVAAAAIVTTALVLLARRGRALRLVHARGVEPARIALVAFWGTVLAASAVVFVVTTAATDKFGGRYLISAWVALVVLGVAAVRTPRDRLVAAGLASALAVIGIVALVRGDYSDRTTPVTQDAANGVARFVRSQHADHGYASYWTAATLTWQTKETARTYPVWECAPPPSHKLCPFGLHRIDSWYAPRPGVRTFLVLDLTNVPPALTEPDPRVYGKPIAKGGFGTLHVLVYPYDLAQKISRPGAPTRGG